MNVRLFEEPARREIEVRVLCPPESAAAVRLAERIRALAGRVSAYEPGCSERHVVALADVLLFETAPRAVRILLRNGTALETPQRLHEIETALEGTEFVRISRQALVNFDAVAAIRPELNGRLELELDGGRRVLVSRLYAPDIKQRLGIACAAEPSRR